MKFPCVWRRGIYYRITNIKFRRRYVTRANIGREKYETADERTINADAYYPDFLFPLYDSIIKLCFTLWYEKVQYISHLRLRRGSANINNELVRTRYELGLVSSFKFVLSSLLIVFFIVIYELHFIAKPVQWTFADGGQAVPAQGGAK